MFCQQCGKQIPKNSIFCNVCGFKQDKLTNITQNAIENPKEDMEYTESKKQSDIIIDPVGMQKVLPSKKDFNALNIASWVVFGICMPFFALTLFLFLFGMVLVIFNMGFMYLYMWVIFLPNTVILFVLSGGLFVGHNTNIKMLQRFENIISVISESEGDIIVYDKFCDINDNKNKEQLENDLIVMLQQGFLITHKLNLTKKVLTHV